MLIHALSEKVGLSIDTIRFYEKEGLLDESHYQRRENGYREYTEHAVQRLLLIRHGRAAGFTLSEMRSAIGDWETDTLSVQEKEFYLYRKIEEIEQRMQGLADMKAYLQEKIEAMRLHRTLNLNQHNCTADPVADQAETT